jgi:general secretion pathway protein E
MVGEVRDRETADMAIQSALTGHQVFSTLHTNDSVSAVTRLVDIGVPEYLISATVIGVLAQRLVRTLCTACKTPDNGVTAEQLNGIAKPWRMSGGIQAYKPVGCLQCRATGFKGRVGLYELLPITSAIRETLHPRLDMARLRQVAAQEGLKPLRLAGLMKVAEGVTTLDEVLRNTPQWDT